MILFTKTRSLEYIDAYNHIERHLTQLSKRSEIKTKGKVQILPTLFRPAFPFNAFRYSAVTAASYCRVLESREALA